MAGNARVDELRKRLEKEPGSRLFAQLAEELRKDGELEEAIRVSREGLQKHAQYPSARITLGRALLDTGDADGARREFESVLKAAPDNILASRYLGEALEAAGDIEAARQRHRLTLALSPGDKAVLARLEALDAAPVGAPSAWPGAARAAATPPPPPAPVSARPPAPPSAPRVPPPPPPPVELPDPPPIPLVDADVEFELERPYEAPTPPAPPPPPPPPPVAAPEVEAEQEIDFDASPPVRPAPPPFEATLRVPLVEEEERPAPPPKAMAPATARPATPPPAAPAGEDVEPIASATLAELYFNQGFTKRALEVYRKVLLREPANDRARARMRELEALAATPAAPLDRRARLELTIRKLEDLRRALQGVPS